MTDLAPSDDTPPDDTPPSPPAPPAPPAPPSDDTPPDAPPGDTPPDADWRTRIAGDDAKLLGYLGRFGSEKALAEAVKKHNDDIKGGKYVVPLPENATPEEVSAYRKQVGVPDKPEGYLDNLPTGLVVGDDDRPFVDKFLSSMHAQNASPALTGAALETYYGIVEEQAAAEADMIRSAESASIETLREEWGADYKRNLNAMHAHLDTLPEPVANAFKLGRGADGVPLGYNPDVLRWLTGLALDANPFATVVAGGGANQLGAIADEKAAIDKVMRTDRAAYDRDEKMQARYRELINAELKLAGKS